MKVAADGDDHYRIAFDRPNTWSQKYNFIWDKLLDLDIFSPQKWQGRKSPITGHGWSDSSRPLDSPYPPHQDRDWSLWIATMAKEPADFEAIVSPIYDLT